MAMKAAVTQDNVFSHLGFTNSPIFCLSLVNITSGNTAKLNCMLKMTWLRTRSFAVPASPERAVTITAGMMGGGGGGRSRNPGRRGKVRKPSLPNFPAQGAVREGVWAKARQA